MIANPMSSAESASDIWIDLEKWHCMGDAVVITFVWRKCHMDIRTETLDDG